MRYGIVSDIHANLQAWNAVLLDIRSCNVDRIICLGDTVGYGPNPADVLKSVYADIDHFVMGNHDAAVASRIGSDLFNAQAQQSIAWTRTRLNREALRFLGCLPLTLNGGGFRCAHGAFAAPGTFPYLIDAADALPSWQCVHEQLLFVGHTHWPVIFVTGASGTPHVVPPQDFVCEDGKRYIVNPGSVGQPRDGEARASYCVYDTADQSVRWRRVPFDLDAYRGALAAAGVPASMSCFLRHDPRRGRPPLREILNFSPSALPERGVRGAVEVQDISALQRKVARWKTLTAILLAAGMLLAGCAGWIWWRFAGRAETIPSPALLAVDARHLPAGAVLAEIPAATVAVNRPVHGWTLHLGHRRRQTVAVEGDGGEPVVRLHSTTASDPLVLASSPVRVSQGMRICMEGRFRKSPDFKGDVALVVSLRRTLDGEYDATDLFRVKQPNPPRSGHWGQARQTFELPARSDTVTFSVRGAFTGTVEVKDLRLTSR